jgi:hypothetical protein
VPQNNLRFGHTHTLDGLRACRRQNQRGRVRVADVLAGEDQQPAHDKARVLACQQHPREVVQRGVGVAPAHRLDVRRDSVVMVVALLVVAQHRLLQQLLDDGQGDGSLVGRLQRGGLQQVQREPCVAVGAAHEVFQRVGGNLQAACAQPAFGVVQGAFDEQAHFRLAQRFQGQHARPRQQRVAQRQERVLGRRADQRECAVFQVAQQRVLLGAAEVVDFVQQEQGGLSSGFEPSASAFGEPCGCRRRLP